MRENFSTFDTCLFEQFKAVNTSARHIKQIQCFVFIIHKISHDVVKAVMAIITVSIIF